MFAAGISEPGCSAAWKYSHSYSAARDRTARVSIQALHVLLETKGGLIHYHGHSEKPLMERMLATPADAEIVLKLYQLRTEPLMRQARAWMTGEFWPTTTEEFFAVAQNQADPHNAFFRQVVTYWEMAAAMVLHGAVSAELFVDCNAEGFYILAKFAPLLEAVREKMPTFLSKTSELVNRFTAASARYEAVLKNVEARRRSMQSQQQWQVR
jgi:hypothetical protein